MARNVMCALLIAATANFASAQCTVATAVAGGGCSTAVVAGLTEQIVAELGTSQMVNFNGSHVSLGSAVQPYLSPNAANSLLAATSQMNDFISINSAYRSCAQQHLLYQWFLRFQCGITAAARPGSSNHESGVAIDTSFYDYWRPALESNGWRWFGPGDLVHFDYVGSGNVDLRSDGVRAFQRLYNRNNPLNRISEDGVWGPATESAMNSAPCNGYSGAPPPSPPSPTPAPPPSGNCNDCYNCVKFGGGNACAPDPCSQNCAGINECMDCVILWQGGQACMDRCP